MFGWATVIIVFCLSYVDSFIGWNIDKDRVAEIVYAEFYEQGDKEREIGVEPVPLLDRTKVTDLPQLQLGFIDFICKPVYENLAIQLPHLKPLLDQVMANRSKWEALKGKYNGFCSTATSVVSIVCVSRLRDQINNLVVVCSFIFIFHLFIHVMCA
eukprot:m.201268 g.201268  ORF g.201268 m.201268 type:complete len:156 (-) comp13715_c0_seq25:477-944(-)